MYTDLTQINVNSFEKNKCPLFDLFFKCKIFYTKPENKELFQEIDMIGEFIDYFCVGSNYSQGDILDGDLIYDNFKHFDFLCDDFVCDNKIEKNLIMYNRYETNLFHKYIYENDENYSLRIYSNIFCGIYLPCKFIKYENFHFKPINDNYGGNLGYDEYDGYNENNGYDKYDEYDENKSYHIGKRIYFELDCDEVEEKIIKILNLQNIKSILSTNIDELKNITLKRIFTKWLSLNDAENNAENNLKNNADNNLKNNVKNNNTIKTCIPFEPTQKYPNINSQSTETKFLNLNSLVIKSNIYNINEFNRIYGKDIFDNINPGQSINCVFTHFIYFNLKPCEYKISLVDVNLQLKYIHIKNN